MKRLEYEENSDVGVATLLFMGIYGVGPATAREWYQRGLRTLDDVRNRKDGIKPSTSQEVSYNVHDCGTSSEQDNYSLA